MSSPAASMLSLTAPRYTSPSNFTLSHLPTPTIFSPTDVLIKIHATSVNPGDLRRAAGQFKAFCSTTFPHKLGTDLSGTVIEVGSAADFTPGDQVYGFLADTTGAAAEYVVVPASTLSRRPESVTPTAAAALPVVGLTALQAFDYAERTIPGGLGGKTVFVNAGLSGTGSVAVQLAKNVFGAGRVITTVSTGKVARVAELLGEGTVDVVVDYVRQDVLQEVERASVDFFFDTKRQAMTYVSLVKPGAGFVGSISTFPSGEQIREMYPDTPWALRRVLDFVDWIYRWRIRRWGVGYAFFLLQPKDSADRLARLAKWMEEGKLSPVVGRMVKLNDLQGVIQGCEEVLSGKGGVGKFVIEVE